LPIRFVSFSCPHTRREGRPRVLGHNMTEPNPTALGALCAAVAFAASALYVSTIENPARAALDAPAELKAWKPSYKRAAGMQGMLAIIGSVLGWLTFRATGDPAWKVGSIFLASNWPWTVLVLMPINRGLLATPTGNARTHAALVHWIHLHHARTALGLMAAGTMFSALAVK